MRHLYFTQHISTYIRNSPPRLRCHYIQPRLCLLFRLLRNIDVCYFFYNNFFKLFTRVFENEINHIIRSSPLHLHLPHPLLLPLLLRCRDRTPYSRCSLSGNRNTPTWNTCHKAIRPTRE
jgi:hypothetical protein